MQKKLSKAKLKLRERFAQHVVAVIEWHGGTPIAIERGEWTLPTMYGPLRLHIIPDFGDIGAVMTAFDNANLATHRTACNPHSGKWNHHYFTWDLQEASNDFARQIKGVAVVKGETEERLIAACKRAVSFMQGDHETNGIVGVDGMLSVLKTAIAQADGVAA